MLGLKFRLKYKDHITMINSQLLKIFLYCLFVSISRKIHERKKIPKET